MAFTRPRAAQIDFDATNISDSLIRINSAETGDNANDLGIVFERGNHTNAALVWDESADAFRFISTTHTGAGSTTDINISAHHNLHVGTLAYSSLNDGTTTLTATVAELNLLDGVTGIALGNANELVIVDSDGTGFASSSTLSIDDGNNYIGINQSSPEVTLHMTGEGAQTAQIRMEQYNDSGDAPDIRTRRYRGTIASPSAVQSGDYLFRSNHEYYNGTSLLVGGAFAFDNTNNAARTQFSVAVDTDGTGADPAGNNGQFKIDGNDGGAITFNNAYKFPTSDGSANQFLQTNGSGTITFESPTVSDISDLTATATELNILDGVTATTAELNYVDGVTSNIQTQLDGKIDTTGNNTITSTTAGSSAAPEFELFRDITGADANYIGQIKFSADNDADQKTVFAKITGKIGDASDGSEDGIIEIAHQKAGSQNIGIRITSTEFKILNGMDFDVETHDGSSNGLRLNNTLVTATATELNLLDGVSAGTATASKAVIYDSNGGIVASGDINLNDADDQIVHGDTDYNQKQYVLYGTTTDATETEIFVGGTTNSRIPVATDTTVFYECDIAARRTDATGESGGWHLKAVVDNFSDTVADVGNVYEVQVATDDANFAVDVAADNTNDAIAVKVTGAAGKTIRWVAIVRTFEVTQ